MKKKIIIPLVIVIALILFLPIPQGSYDDGGTRDYNALTYKIVVWNKIMAEWDENGQLVHNTYRKTSVFWYPDNQKSIDELWQMERENAKVGTSQQPVTDILKRSEAKYLTQKQIEQALKGLSNTALYAAWGEPDGYLSGFFGDIWRLDGEKNIIVYYDNDGIVEHVKFDKFIR